ncbi:hypothetical protein K504DRAFT_379119 [Pleomassaria siparia CBS 279.74]|uniref:BZIP domain-containing protein n=1 Tax=Pleomassaria siparia CBS 279.74 TaxID=1314801 RepID=A0A6G1K909_9PLEO|nr:hypothetical protein K504DRAFT_379119 [Pleomassaria siparia CBS 279.74]
MSGYHGRRGPNVSQYVANLNTLPTQQDLLAEPVNLEEDLAVFTSAEFIDWDATVVDLNSPLDFLDNDPQQRSSREHAGQAVDEPKLDFSMTGDFQFADFPGFTNSISGQSLQGLPPAHNAYPVPASFTSPVATSVSPVTPGFDGPLGKKRRLDSVDPLSQPPTDEPARVAAEEDKRRRNTAASARFRVKKKQREQALEKTAKEMTDRVNMLESKIAQLETENAWLKGLITDKGASGTKASSADLNSMLKKRVDGERSSGNRTDGVGTGVKILKA